jgi:hypothetical protein
LRGVYRSTSSKQVMTVELSIEPQPNMIRRAETAKMQNQQ